MFCIKFFIFFIWFTIPCSYAQQLNPLKSFTNTINSEKLSEVHKILKVLDVNELILDGFSHLDLNLSLPLSTECIEDLIPIVLYSTLKNYSGVPDDFITGPLLQMLDSTGKIPPGIGAGALIFWGYYPECHRISYKYPGRQRLYEAEYSRGYLNLALKDGKDPANCQNGYLSMIAWDFCLPKGCVHDDVLFLLQNVLTIPPTNSSPFCMVNLISDIPKKTNYKTLIIWIVMGTIIGVGILSSFVDYFLIDTDSPTRKDLSVKIFLCFSLYNNIKEIFTVGSSKKSGQIGTLHCIRFFSICWVIQGHSLNIAFAFMNNAFDFMEIIKDLPTQLIVNAMFSVDSFFFISGLLLAFLWFKEYKKNKETVMSPQAWGLFYLHRIVRLSPPYYLILVFSIFVYPTLLHNMPLYLTPDAVESINPDSCEQNFWVNLLYLNNYIYFKTECYSLSWYLATDMQMFVFTPLLLIPLAMNKFLGLAIAGIVFVASTSANIITVYKNHYPPTVEVFGWIDPQEKHRDEYLLLEYAAPYIRCQVYIIGLLVGYFMQMTPKLKINKMLNLIAWALTGVLMLFVLSCLYRYMNGHELSLFGRAMYSAFSKPIWAAGLSWIVVSCYYGYGGPINQFMSWNIWVPLSRLSYCVYLIHIIVVYILIGLTQAPIIYSGFVHIWVTIVFPAIFFSFFFSVIWSAAFEIPFSKAEMALFRSSARKTEKVDHENEKPLEGWEIMDQFYLDQPKSLPERF